MPSGTVNIDAGGYGCTNHSSWYQNGGTHAIFPLINVNLHAWVWDYAASGMTGILLDTEQYPCTYQILSLTSVRITFTAWAKGEGRVAQSAGWGLYFTQVDHEAQQSNVYSLSNQAGNDQYRAISFTIDCVLDVKTLGVPLGEFAEDTYATIIG